MKIVLILVVSIMLVVTCLGLLGCEYDSTNVDIDVSTIPPDKLAMLERVNKKTRYKSIQYIQYIACPLQALTDHRDERLRGCGTFLLGSGGVSINGDIIPRYQFLAELPSGSSSMFIIDAQEIGIHMLPDDGVPMLYIARRPGLRLYCPLESAICAKDILRSKGSLIFEIQVPSSAIEQHYKIDLE